MELAKRLVGEQEVAIAPGVFFDREGHFRLCFTRSREEVVDALAVLGRGLDSVLGHSG